MASQPVSNNAGAELSRALELIKTRQVFGKGEPLFQQGSPADGIYLIESGEVRILLPTGMRYKQLLGIAGAGAILGLSENMAGEVHRSTAEADDDTTAAFIPRSDFLGFLREHPVQSMQVVRLLSEELHSIYHKFRSITAHPGRPRNRRLDEQLN